MTISGESDEKKKYLNGYRYAKRREAQLSQQIKELRGQRMFPGILDDGLPKGSGYHDLSEYAARLDELITQLEREREQAVKQYKEIHDQIHKMRDDKEKEVLERRYLMGMHWERIAVEMNYNYRWVLRIHGKALHHFEIPDKKPRKAT